MRRRLRWRSLGRGTRGTRGRVKEGRGYTHGGVRGHSRRSTVVDHDPCLLVGFFTFPDSGPGSSVPLRSWGLSQSPASSVEGKVNGEVKNKRDGETRVAFPPWLRDSSWNRVGEGDEGLPDSPNTASFPFRINEVLPDPVDSLWVPSSLPVSFTSVFYRLSVYRLSELRV